jgi:hypothetical protein
MNNALLILRYGVAVITLLFLGGLGTIILLKIARGTMDLDLLLSNSVAPGSASPADTKDPLQSNASMSRFQLLVFTFVIALSTLYVALGNPSVTLPNVPAGLLGLLGISAGSYVAGKGLDVHQDTTNKGNVLKAAAPHVQEVQPVDDGTH